MNGVADRWRPHTSARLQWFESSPGRQNLKKRIAAETPEIHRCGVHVLASQNDTGAMLPRDSHEYDNDISFFDNAEIDDIILPELRRMIRFPSFAAGMASTQTAGGCRLRCGPSARRKHRHRSRWRRHDIAVQFGGGVLE